MFKTRRKRAVVLALIAFFCTAASVSVDWRRFGGGILAFFTTRSGPIVAVTGGRSAGSDGVHIADVSANRHDGGSPPVLASAVARHHRASTTAVTGNDDEDLFKYGNPAAGGIPPGSFIVAKNDAPPVVDHGAPTPEGGRIAPEITGSPAPADGVTTPAPTPTTGNGALPVRGAGTTDPGGGDGATPPPSPLPPVSVIPEASSLQMMTLGVLFLAVASARRRKTH